MKKQGLIFAITGPSGAGKTTYSRALRELFPEACSSIVYTTRKPRPGEKEGVQYHFVSRKEFGKLEAGNALACSTDFCDNLYGIEKAYVGEVTERQGRNMIFDTIFPAPELRKMGNVVIIYLDAPPKELRKRIIARDTSIPKEEVHKRMRDMLRQMRVKGLCDHIVDTSASRTPEQVVNELAGIIRRYLKPTRPEPDKSIAGIKKGGEREER